MGDYTPLYTGKVKGANELCFAYTRPDFELLCKPIPKDLHERKIMLRE